MPECLFRFAEKNKGMENRDGSPFPVCGFSRGYADRTA